MSAVWSAHGIVRITSLISKPVVELGIAFFSILEPSLARANTDASSTVI